MARGVRANTQLRAYEHYRENRGILNGFSNALNGVVLRNMDEYGVRRPIREILQNFADERGMSVKVLCEQTKIREQAMKKFLRGDGILFDQLMTIKDYLKKHKAISY